MAFRPSVGYAKIRAALAAEDFDQLEHRYQIRRAMRKLIVAASLALMITAALSQETASKPKPAAGRTAATTAPAEPAARPLETGVMRTIAPERPAATTPAATATIAPIAAPASQPSA